MESVSCPVCGSNNSKFLWMKDDATYARCNVCSLVYENPRLSEKELVEFYSDKSYFIRDNEAKPTSGYENYYTQCTQALVGEYFDIIEQYATRKPGSFCDVGCGPGGVLKIAKARGWDAVGVEVSSWAAQEGKKNGLNIFEGSLLDAAFPSNHFDAVSMFDVLEHLTAPKEYIGEIHRILKPGGVLVVETPNVDGFFARHIYQENADLIKPRAHICLYGPASAKHLVSSIGFSDFKIMTFPYSRRISPGYIKSVITSRLIKGRTPVQLTLNDSLRVVCWK